MEAGTKETKLENLRLSGLMRPHVVVLSLGSFAGVDRLMPNAVLSGSRPEPLSSEWVPGHQY